MTTQTLTLTDFLLSRIAEDAPDGHDYWCTHSQVANGVCDCRRRRQLAEREAKRRIVERLADVIGTHPPRSTLDENGWELLAWESLFDLAAVYADHPDYREEWRP